MVKERGGGPSETQKPITIALSPSFQAMASDGTLIVLDFISKALARPYRVSSSSLPADLTIISVLDLKREFLKKRWTARFTPPANMERMARALSQSEKFLVVAFENLQHPAWADFGRLLIDSKVKRLTFFPEEVDSNGARLPYWWNYLDFPDFPRPEATYGRYGRLYSLEKLMTPIPRISNRLSRACWIGSYVAEPRASFLRVADSQFGLDVFGSAGSPMHAPKAEVLSRYRYAVAAENSLGIGYDTEKVPEVWDSGCLPVATFTQPMSDFNPRALNLLEPAQSHRHPLLLSAPNPIRVLEYLVGAFG